MTFARAALIAACLSLSGPALADVGAGSAKNTATPMEGSQDRLKLEVRQTIEAQLDAFRAGDDAAAYALAAPGVKRMFSSPESFVRMVQRGYGPVYNAMNPVFLRAEPMGETGYLQEVGLSGPKGGSWLALYTLARQPDGSWLITGCYLKKDAGKDI